VAESTLSISYPVLQREVAFFLGWERDPSLWDNTQSQDFDDITRRALRAFYFPPSTGDQPVYEWTFLRKTGSITLVAATTEYDLADDFGGTILDSSTRYAASVVQIPLKKVDEHVIEQLQATDAQNGFPKYYAVRNKAHAPTTGQRWEMVVYPTPQAAQATSVISFRYVHVPNEISNTNLYPVGGAQYGEVVLASHLAAAEFKQDDDPNGPMTQKFSEMLQAAIRNDTNQKTNERGGVA
jgi:hypothetical protein